jgi:menaquinone-9 beta-reductase
VVAEGISMAMQSAGLLAQHLLPQRGQIDRAAVREEIGRRYAAAWRRNFAGRIRAAALVAHWAMRPGLVQATLPVLRGCPRLITMFARLAGKSQMIQLPAALSLAESPCP